MVISNETPSLRLVTVPLPFASKVNVILAVCVLNVVSTLLLSVIT